jgi:hypothetical protein
MSKYAELPFPIDKLVNLVRGYKNLSVVTIASHFGRQAMKEDEPISFRDGSG